MRENSADLIQSWFVRHDGDGEFQCGERVFPYTVIGPAGMDRFIFTTKPRGVLAIIERCGVQDGIGMIGRYGLPAAADLEWIRKIVGRRRLLFLGDMDPVDLLVFAWLAERLGSRRVGYLGVNDALLDALRIRPVQPLLIECALSERKSLAFLKRVFPAFPAVVGPRCAQMLERGEKMEFEAVVSAKKAAAAWRLLLETCP